jgi:hypothetical protein
LTTPSTAPWLQPLPAGLLLSLVQSLKSTKGQKAEIDAGQGVSVTLEYIGK